MSTQFDAEGNEIEQELTPEQREILREAESRGSLIDNHPDLQNKSPEAPVPNYQPIRSFHEPAPKAVNWRVRKAHEESGYGGYVDSEEYRKLREGK
jgi:hypothetical protein